MHIIIHAIQSTAAILEIALALIAAVVSLF